MYAVTALKINCGYARTAIRELTPKRKGYHGRQINTEERTTKFKQQFSNITFPQDLFETNSKNECRFDKNCDAILNMFSKKWKAPLRESYEKTFSVEKWKALSQEEQRKHSISNCDACSRNFHELQHAFPGRPLYQTDPVVSLDLKDMETEKQEVRTVLRDLDNIWTEKYNHSFSSAIPSLAPSANLTTKLTKQEKKKKDRQMRRKISKHIGSQLSENTTLTMLAEGDSLQSYNRKRLAMSFEKPESPAKRTKSHTRSEQNQNWNREDAMELLTSHPSDQKINWTKAAKSLNIQAGNPGQELKKFAVDKGLDILALDQRMSEPPPRVRAVHKKLPGGEISIPALPTVNKIREEKRSLIDDSTLSIGEPCSPFDTTKTVVTPDGDVVTNITKICGRKIPLHYLRQKMLKQQEKYMRLWSDDEIAKLTTDEALTFLHDYHHTPESDATLAELHQLVASVQRTRAIALWHDHSTILKQGYILFAVWVVYDPAVFLSESEYYHKTKIAVKNILTIVEQPKIYMIAPCTSSPSDQLSLTVDRIECLHELSEKPVSALNGITLKDTMRFFCGDKPAQQFERGTQIGGDYPCGPCGCLVSTMHNLTSVLQCPHRSLQDLQTLVLAGKYGNTPNALKPLDNLLIDPLRKELNSRGFTTSGMKKGALQEVLRAELRGVQKVPTLLTLQPTQSLESLNLQDYEVLDCEPLHDFKGHAYNILQELPGLLEQPVQNEIRQVIETTVPKKKLCGALVRAAVIKVYLKLRKCTGVPQDVELLIGTLARISEILYSFDKNRTSKKILMLYNITWLHHELCCDLIHTPKQQTKEHFYGTYFHDLIVHAPRQYEIVNPRSVNAESTERLFSQVKHISLKATNRKPDNVLVTILLSMQAKEIVGMGGNTQKESSVVKAVSDKMPKYKGTVVNKKFVAEHQHSWQAHLIRISKYLQCGEGEWWKTEGDTYKFLDADNDPEHRDCGPELQHFRNTTIKEVVDSKYAIWGKILNDRVNLPTPYIRLFGKDGSYNGRHYFEPQFRCAEQGEDTMTEEESSMDTSESENGHTEDMIEQEQNPRKNEQTQSEHTQTRGMAHETTNGENGDKADEDDTSDTHEQWSEREQQVSILAEDADVLTTKAANLIQKGLQGASSTTLLEFDRSRTVLKNLKQKGESPTPEQKQNYETLLAKLHTMVTSEKYRLKAQIETMEREHYMTHGILPNTEEYLTLRDKLDNVRKLLSIWSKL